MPVEVLAATTYAACTAAGAARAAQGHEAEVLSLGSGGVGRAGEGQGWWRQALGEEDRGHGRRWPETEKAMVKFAGYLVGERKTNRKRSNSDGFDKRDTLRYRGRRDLPCGGGG